MCNPWMTCFISFFFLLLFSFFLFFFFLLPSPFFLFFFLEEIGVRQLLVSDNRACHGMPGMPLSYAPVNRGPVSIIAFVKGHSGRLLRLFARTSRYAHSAHSLGHTLLCFIHFARSLHSWARSLFAHSPIRWLKFTNVYILKTRLTASDCLLTVYSAFF